MAPNQILIIVFSCMCSWDQFSSLRCGLVGTILYSMCSLVDTCLNNMSDLFVMLEFMTLWHLHISIPHPHTPPYRSQAPTPSFKMCLSLSPSSSSSAHNALVSAADQIINDTLTPISLFSTKTSPGTNDDYIWSIYNWLAAAAAVLRITMRVLLPPWADSPIRGGGEWMDGISGLKINK